MSQLPNITAEEYRAAIAAFRAEEHAKNNPDQSYLHLLDERERYASGLVHIIKLEQPLAYLLAYENKYMIKLVNAGLMFLINMQQDENLVKQITIDYLLRKTHWFNQFVVNERNRHIYETISNALMNPNTNPHVEYFRSRFKVTHGKIWKVADVLPEGFQYEIAETFDICCGDCHDPNSEIFDLQFDCYFRTLVELLSPNATDADLVKILCKQLTNEISNVRSTMRIDVALIDRVREIMQKDPRTVNMNVNQYLTDIKTRDAGEELAGCTVAMLRRIFPTLRITAITPAEEAKYSGFIRDC